MEYQPPILLVDNDERIIELLRIVLEGEGYNVNTAYCGEAALEKVRVAKFAVVILDYALPDMKGDEIAEKIRLEYPEAGIIMVTGFKQALGPDKQNKFNYIFEKPVDPREILTAVKQMMKVPKQINKQII